MGRFIYKGVDIDESRGKYMVCTNKDLLKLGLCTHKTLQKGHPGYVSLKRLIKLIDEKRSKLY